jgi:hypothetical protein
MAIQSTSINRDLLKKYKMIAYKQLVEKLKKDYIKTRKYQIDNFSINISSTNNSANFSSTNMHVFDAYKQISTYVKGNDLYKDETKGFEMNIEFRIGSVISSITMVSKKTDSKIKIRVINFRVGLITVPLDLEKDIVVKGQTVRILKLNKIRSIKRFKRFFYYLIHRLYNIVNKVKEE